MNKNAIIAAIVLLTGIASFVPAQAGNLGAANDFNAFILGDVNTSGGHSDGAIAVQGDWSGNYYEVKQHGGFYPTVPGTSNAALYMAGNNEVTGYLRTLQGNAYVGGTSGNLQLNGNSLSSGVDPNFFVEAETYLRSLSEVLASYDSITLDTSDMNNINVNLAANTLNGSLKVYTVDVSQMGGLKTLNFSNGTSTDTIVINVTGQVLDTWGWQMNYAYKNNVLWNFVDATQIDIDQRNFDGSILALNATVNQSQNIQGTLIAKEWNTSGAPELHFGDQFKFTGDLPAVPEPGSMLFIGAAVMIFVMKRRNYRHA